MGRIRTSMTLEADLLKQIDALLVPPVCRSDLLNAVLRYLLAQPDFISHMVKCELREIRYRIDTIDRTNS